MKFTSFFNIISDVALMKLFTVSSAVIRNDSIDRSQIFDLQIRKSAIMIDMIHLVI